ncbi:hypothetical protein DXG01_004149 [Tephrocybe rancida]|nr:hypothetical protein DXG01_004149 [Tephrocybe rancida]
MKFFATLALLPTLALGVTLSFDRTYDNAAGSLLTVACSNGPNGLDPPFSTFGSIPKFPHIGGAAAVEGFGSANCGSCWGLTYTNPKGVAKSINVTAIDHTDAGFNIAFAAMNELTGGQAEFLGRVDVTAVKIFIATNDKAGDG